MNRLQGDPKGALVPGNCFVPWHLRCAASRRTNLLPSAHGQGHEIIQKLSGRALRSRRTAERRGRWAERLAAWSCRFKGFRVLATRYRTPSGEIDLVLRRRSLLIFAEVKARKSFELAMEALRPQQQMRLARAAEVFLKHHPIHVGCAIRFDLIAIRPWRLPRQIVDAWRPDH